MKKTIVSLIIIVAFAAAGFSQSVIGRWKTIDDVSNKPKSVIEFRIVKDKAGKELLMGKIVKLFRQPNEDQDPICDKCPDARKNQKIMGMDIVTNLTRNGAGWSGDKGIIDPDNGKIYDCKIWVDEKDANILHVRGYIAFLYRTQTWYKEK